MKFHGKKEKKKTKQNKNQLNFVNKKVVTFSKLFKLITIIKINYLISKNLIITHCIIKIKNFSKDSVHHFSIILIHMHI